MQTPKHQFLALLILLCMTGAPITTIGQEDMSPDAKTLKALVDAGSDLTKPHEFNHWFYFSSELNAQAAAKDLIAAGYSIDMVGQTDDRKQWRVLALNTIVPNLPDVEKQSAFLERLAHRHDGDYDGWETQVEP